MSGARKARRKSNPRRSSIRHADGSTPGAGITFRIQTRGRPQCDVLHRDYVTEAEARQWQEIRAAAAAAAAAATAAARPNRRPRRDRSRQRSHVTPPESDRSRLGSPAAAGLSGGTSATEDYGEDGEDEDDDHDDAPGSAGAAAAVSGGRAHQKRPAPPVDVNAAPNGGDRRKRCTCCGTDVTPLWRQVHARPDRSGASLCNACGIRFKKYHIICPYCAYVPTKQEHVEALCARCRRPYG
mmetsp:Transcript_33344/g.87453  ORF Transcript_33344/g.87453 Transcript_33344/m.87453 type:complete len:240 (-) Transcript_33344:440-1159(-)